jgi:hypothetical protein
VVLELEYVLEPSSTLILKEVEMELNTSAEHDWTVVLIPCHHSPIQSAMAFGPSCWF